MCRTVSTRTLSYRSRGSDQKNDDQSPAAAAPPATSSQRSRTFLRCWRPPGRAGPRAAPSAITMLPLLSLRPDSESCSLPRLRSGHHFSPGPPTTSAARTRPTGRAGVRGGPGRVQLSRKWEQRGEAKKTILLRRGGPRPAAPPRPPKTLVEDPRGGPPLPRTTKKNVEVGAALHGRPESTSYPLAVQTLKDRAVSWVRPHRAEVTFGPPSLLQNKYLRSNLSFM